MLNVRPLEFTDIRYRTDGELPTAAGPRGHFFPACAMSGIVSGIAAVKSTAESPVTTNAPSGGVAVRRDSRFRSLASDGQRSLNDSTEFVY